MTRVKRSYFEKGTPVEVTWDDAVHYEQELHDDDDLKMRRRILGYVLRHDRMGVLVAASHDEDDGFEKGYGIPAKYICCIKELVPL